jgi:hypothetical protein
MSKFWSSEFRVEDDALNAEIWSRSPDVQCEIQPPSEVPSDGAGAQQAILLDGRVLPWVPDILGRNWREADSVVIVGSAYAPFVEHFSNRGRVMSRKVYENASTWQEFQQAFVASVVDGDDRYYGPLMPLAAVTAAPNDCSNLALLDLCRASFVAVSEGKFTGRDSVLKKHCRLFADYVEHSQNQSWLWQRLTATEATRIVALGTIAEHGLLRLFDTHRCVLRVNGTIKPLPRCDVGKWVKGGFWLHAHGGDWWDIQSRYEGEERRWALLPVPHPGAYGSRDDYSRERELLQKML